MQNDCLASLSARTARRQRRLRKSAASPIVCITTCTALISSRGQKKLSCAPFAWQRRDLDGNWMRDCESACTTLTLSVTRSVGCGNAITAYANLCYEHSASVTMAQAQARCQRRASARLLRPPWRRANCAPPPPPPPPLSLPHRRLRHLNAAVGCSSRHCKYARLLNAGTLLVRVSIEIAPALQVRI